MKLKHGVILFTMALCLVGISYFIPRYNSFSLLTTYTFLFLIYLFGYHYQQELSIKKLAIGAIALRVLMHFSIPSLSDDVYRFLWDGAMWLENIDAYEFLPSSLIEQFKTDPYLLELYQKMNSPNYYTIYPPLNQLLFIVASFSKNSFIGILTIRSFILLAEIASLVGIYKLIKLGKMSTFAFYLYAFNPLILLELTVNLHFEAFIISCLVWAMVFYYKNQSSKIAGLMGLAIGVKILPIIYLAAFFKKLSIKNYIALIIVACAVAAVLFFPLIQTSLVEGTSTSAALYFQNFEFNASIYYLIREIGYWRYGYNIIQSVGPYLGVLSILFIILYNLIVSSSRPIGERLLFSWTIYCLMAMTIHPWYILPLIVFGLQSKYYFPILWSFCIFWTYIGYTETGFEESLLVTSIEYLLVIGFGLYEIILKNRKNDPQPHEI